MFGSITIQVSNHSPYDSHYHILAPSLYIILFYYHTMDLFYFILHPFQTRLANKTYEREGKLKMRDNSGDCVAYVHNRLVGFPAKYLGLF